MAYRYGEREQGILFPQRIEEYVACEHPVRAYDACIEVMNIRTLGIDVDSDKEGNPEYEPKTMLKLLVYGYSYGTQSSRRLEQATHETLPFIWLMGGMKPDYRTIARFRKNNKKALKNVLKQCGKLCMKLNLIEGNTLFIDGTKIRGNCGRKNTWDTKRCEKALEKLDKRIDEILDECERIDEEESGNGSLVKMPEDLVDAKRRKEKIEKILKELEETDKKNINTVDPDSTMYKSIQGSHAGYNAQITVDEKHGLIVSSDVVNEANDLGQCAQQVKNAEDVLEKKCHTIVADAGYANTEELHKVVEEEITVIVPTNKQTKNTGPGPFDKRNFRYEEKEDCYYCPEGKKLVFRAIDRERESRVYQIRRAKICRNCCYFGRCTQNQKGRSIKRLKHEQTRQELEALFKQKEIQEIYKKRKEKVEHPFGHIKRNLGVRSFLLRGLEGVQAEMSLFASCFNIRRMITLLGVDGLIEKLGV